MSVYAINLTDFNDRSLMKAVNDVPSSSVLLFEDIDCMKSSQSRKEGPVDNGQNAKESATLQSGVTLSGLLNVLDGLYAPSGVLFVMTTNHIENLDKALLRPGRSTTNCTWEKRATARRWSCSAGFSRVQRKPKHGSLSKLRQVQKPWPNSRASYCV